MSHPAIQRAEAVLAEFHKYFDDEASFGPPADEARFKAFGERLGYGLPVDFVYFLTKHNSFDAGGTEVYGLDPAYGEQSLDRVYLFEHDDAAMNPMPPHFLPFSGDGAGNHYCLDLQRLQNGTCPVVFWQHDARYKHLGEVETCNDTFTDWVKEVMIDWTLDDMDDED